MAEEERINSCGGKPELWKDGLSPGMSDHSAQYLQLHSF